MQSITYIANVTSWVTGLAAAGITFSCVMSGYSYFMEGNELADVMKKIGKRLRAGILLILITSIIQFLKGYWL